MKGIAFVCLIFVSVLPFYLCISADQYAAEPSPKSKDGFQFLFINGNNGVKVERLRKIFLKFEDSLNRNIGKWKKRHGDDIPNLLKFVLKDGKLSKDLKHVMKKNIPLMHHEIFLRKLNKFLENLSNGNVESVHFFKNAVGVKVNSHGPLEGKSPRYQDHSFLTVPTRDPNSEKRVIKYMKKRLQNHVKKWTEPSFMEYEESKLLKKHLTDVALSVFTAPGKILLPPKSEVFVDCIATPQYYATIRWEIDGRVIPFYQMGKRNGNMFVFPNGTLYIKSLHKRDIGVYTCVAATKTEQRYATSVIAVAYLEHIFPIEDIETFEGNTEELLRCIPPFGVPPPTVVWAKNGELIQNPRINTDSWELVIKDIQMSDSGNYTCIATNMARQRNATVNVLVIPVLPPTKVQPVKTVKSADERLLERWVGEHFTKPHHLSVDESNLNNKRVINSATEPTDSNNAVEKELRENGIGKALMKGIIEERNLPWSTNDVYSKLTEEQKDRYIQAETEWEKKLTEEAQRLLDQLQPADAYIIPDVPIFDGGKKKLKGVDAARVIRQELENVARRKMMFAGNENWEAVDESKAEKKEDTKWLDGNALKKKLNEIFENKLAEEEEEWLGVEKDVYSKLGILEKYAKSKNSRY